MIKNHLRLYKSLNGRRVKYIIIGGVAAIVYGVPRSTLDVDIFIEPSLKNAEKLLKALKGAGFGTASLTSPQKVIGNELTVFEDYIRLDVFTKVKGMQFEKAWKHRVIKKIKAIPIKFASLKDIISSKKASKRHIDKEDLKLLKQLI
ncbi:MAG: nucleotidyltransferase [Desulfobacteraceae bacterium]|nr:nucleotidyltransferase [Desulfobacteraceae bacterium]